MWENIFSYATSMLANALNIFIKDKNKKKKYS